MSSESKNTEIPVLENSCTECHGRGEWKECGLVVKCYLCHGSGTIPTEYGRRVLSLLKSNLKTILFESGIR
jgi:DnaJ-class molecular chaperone